ncbi:MAG: hypothetical protein ACRD3M_12315 [Thermoanaerobaculia bacterium]
MPRVPVVVMGAFPLSNTLLALLWGSLLAGEIPSARSVAGGP